VFFVFEDIINLSPDDQRRVKLFLTQCHVGDTDWQTFVMLCNSVTLEYALYWLCFYSDIFNKDVFENQELFNHINLEHVYFTLFTQYDTIFKILNRLQRGEDWNPLCVDAQVMIPFWEYMYATAQFDLVKYLKDDMVADGFKKCPWLGRLRMLNAYSIQDINLYRAMLHIPDYIDIEGSDLASIPRYSDTDYTDLEHLMDLALNTDQVDSINLLVKDYTCQFFGKRIHRVWRKYVHHLVDRLDFVSMLSNVISFYSTSIEKDPSSSYFYLLQVIEIMDNMKENYYNDDSIDKSKYRELVMMYISNCSVIKSEWPSIFIKSFLDLHELLHTLFIADSSHWYKEYWLISSIVGQVSEYIQNNIDKFNDLLLQACDDTRRKLDDLRYQLRSDLGMPARDLVEVLDFDSVATFLIYYKQPFGLIKPLLLFFRQIPVCIIDSDLNIHSNNSGVLGVQDEKRYDEPEEYTTSFFQWLQSLTGLIHDLFKMANDYTDPIGLRKDLAIYFADRLKPVKKKRDSVDQPDKPGWDHSVKEPSPEWRLGYVAAIGELGVNPGGKLHYVLQKVRDHDQSEVVRYEAARTVSRIQKLKTGVNEEISSKRALLNAWWYLRRAHFLSFNTLNALDIEGAEKVKSKEVREN
jgi:hypothetical protein